MTVTLLYVTNFGSKWFSHKHLDAIYNSLRDGFWPIIARFFKKVI